MELNNIQAQINEIRDASEKKIAQLLYDIGFNFIAANSTIINDKSEPIGEIDLLFTHDNYLLVIEVSIKHTANDKKTLFFNKWSNDTNVKFLINQHTLSSRKIIRIYFDLSTTHPTSSQSTRNILENNSMNKIAYNDDYLYFKEQYEIIERWSKNDFLDWLELDGISENKPLDAIQFYLGDTIAFCFAERVDVLLKSCYVSRRRNRIKGYQRILNKTRIDKMLKNIVKSESLTFPNSILISTPKLTEKLESKENCPKITKINFPTSYATCKIIDGQHRLLGFSKIDSELQKNYSLPIIAIPEFEKNNEVKTFIAINTNQKKIDANLLLLLKSDQSWGIGTKEDREKIAVLVSMKLNETFLKNRIHFGLTKKPKNHITLNTLVTSMNKNKQILDTFDDTYDKIQKLFKSVINNISNNAFHNDNFFGQNIGIRVLFRLSKLHEINVEQNNTSVSLDCFFKDLSPIMSKDEVIDNLGKFSSNVGVHDATKYLIKILEDTNAKQYSHMMTEFK